jgi:hypothetical protein
MADVRFWKGVGVGTHHHATDLTRSGLQPRLAASLSEIVVQDHVARTTDRSPCTSLTWSFGVARDYAMNASKRAPTQNDAAWVYELHIPEDQNMVRFVDPVQYISAHSSNPLSSIRFNYYHSGDSKFLGITAYGLATGASYPDELLPHGAGGPVIQTDSHKTIVYAIRDAEVLVHGMIPKEWFKHRHPIF